MDETGGRVGMFYKKRRGEPEAAAGALAEALRHAIAGARLVESHADGVAFATDQVVVGFEDRLAAPNDSATFEALTPELTLLAERLFGDGATVTQVGDDRAPFRARLAGASEVGLDAMSSRLS